MANGEWGVYRGAINLNNENDIQHWKYIRKYRVGDKFRYVYADDETHKTIGNEYSQYLSTKERAKRYAEDAKRYDKQWNTAGLFKNDPNKVAAANTYKKKYYEATNKAASNKQASPRWYKAYINNVENNSVSKLLNDAKKSWKAKANKVFDRLKIEAKSLSDLHKEAVNKRNERKAYGVTIGDEIKNRVDYATDPDQWFAGPYKSALTKKKEKFAAEAKKQEEEYKKKHPISYYLSKKYSKPRHGGSSGSTFADKQKRYATSGRNF